MNYRKALIVSAAVVAAIALGVAACARHPQGDAAAPGRAVRVAAVATAPMAGKISVVGVLGPKDETRLAFKVGGVIEAVRVEEGTPVKAGQLLALVKQTEIGAALEQARQAAAKTERDLGRITALYADGVATEEQVQDLTTAARVAAAQLRTAEFNSAYARIVAPADGVVLRKLAEANELVQAGQPVLVVGGGGRGWIVRVGLADRDIVRVQLGDMAQLSFDAYPGLAFTGRLSNLSSSADPATGTFTAEVQVEPGSARFVQGLVARVTLAPRDGRVSQVVPVTALVEANGSEATVFVLAADGKTVRRVMIRIGRLNDGAIEVLDGLPPGTRVVVDGAAFLENGEAVRIAADDGRVPARAG